MQMCLLGLQNRNERFRRNFLTQNQFLAVVTKQMNLSHAFYYHAISQDLLQIQTINTPPEPFRPTDVPFGDYKTETKDSGGIFGCKIDFWL